MLTSLFRCLVAGLTAGMWLLPVSGRAAFTAYHDCASGSNETPLAATYTTNASLVGTVTATVALKDSASGLTLPVSIQFSGGGWGGVWAGDTSAQPVGSDVYSMFYGKVPYYPCYQAIDNGSNAYVRFTGLDPAKHYTVGIFGGRTNGPNYTNRFTKITLSGADAYTNASSAGVEISEAGATSRTCAANDVGRLVQYTDIRAGDDGWIQFHVRGDTSSGYLNAIMLQEFDAEGGGTPTNPPTGNVWKRASITGAINGTNCLMYLYIDTNNLGKVFIDDVCMVAGTAPESGQNLIVNPGLESGTTGWSFVGEHAISTLESALTHGGASALQLQSTGATAGGSGNSVQQNVTGFTAGNTYTLSFWYFATNAVDFVARFSGHSAMTLLTQVPVGGTVSNVTPPNIPQMSQGAAWDYMDFGGNLWGWRGIGIPIDWWCRGKGPFGFNRSPVTTTIQYGPESANKYITTHFRREIQLDDAGSLGPITFNGMAEDGLVVFINSNEIFRLNMPVPSLAPWAVFGNHSTTTATTNRFRNGANSLLLQATSVSPGDTNNCIRQGISGLTVSGWYVASCWYLATGAVEFVLGCPDQPAILRTFNVPAGGTTNSTGQYAWRQACATGQVNDTKATLCLYANNTAGKVFIDDVTFVSGSIAEMGSSAGGNLSFDETTLTTMPASSDVSSPSAFTFTVPGSAFRNGENVIAAEVHLAATNAGSMYFDMWTTDDLMGPDVSLPVLAGAPAYVVMPSDWFSRFYAGVTNRLPQELVNQDTDGDGRIGWEEYMAGTDPTDPASQFAMTGIVATGGVTRIGWFGGTNGPSTPYRILFTTNIVHGPWTTVATSQRVNGSNFVTVAASTNELGFYKVGAGN